VNGTGESEHRRVGRERKKGRGFTSKKSSRTPLAIHKRRSPESQIARIGIGGFSSLGETSRAVVRCGRTTCHAPPDRCAKLQRKPAFRRKRTGLQGKNGCETFANRWQRLRPWCFGALKQVWINGLVTQKPYLSVVTGKKSGEEKGEFDTTCVVCRKTSRHHVWTREGRSRRGSVKGGKKRKTRQRGQNSVTKEKLPFQGGLSTN